MKIRDRIKELRRVRAGDLVPHTKNWRTHPQAQRDALEGVLAEVGFADALLVRELPNGRLGLIDGHLRAETNPDCKVPVLVLDVDEAEAEKILLLHDPLATLAEADPQQAEALISSNRFQQQKVAEMLSGLRKRLKRAEQLMRKPQNLADVMIPASFQVVVECRNEAEQQAVFHQMTEEGYRCRVLTL